MYSGPQDTRVLTGVMDQDSAAWAVAPENYRYALNLINTLNQQSGSHTNIKSTIEVVNSNLKNGDNKCVGFFEDVKGGSVIFLIYNSNGYHAIFRWWQNYAGFPNGKIEVVYQVQDPSQYNSDNPNPLSLDPDHLVTGINLVDDLLYWTDYNTGPKMINIKRANTTSRFKTFNLYFNNNAFEVFVSLTHTLSLYPPGSTPSVASLSWAMPISVKTYAEAVNNLMQAYGGSTFAQYVTLVDKGNYVQATLLYEGDYYLDWTNNAFSPYYSGVVVPDNFYPDATPTLVSYLPTSIELIERIKYPPFKSPAGAFSIEGLGNVNFDIANYSLVATATPPQILPQPFDVYYYYSGITTVNLDTFSLVTTGANSISTSYTDFNAYIENTFSYPILLNLRINLSVQILGWFGMQYPFPPGGGLIQPPSNQAFGIYMSLATSAGVAPTNITSLFAWDATKYVGAGEFDPTTTYSIINTYQVVLQPGEKLGVFSISSGLYSNVSGNVSGEVLSAAVNSYEANIFPSFRAKYIYKDYQNSVYGAISPTIVSPSSRYKNIEIDFSDPRLENPESLSDIKNVVLAVSLDSGVTWSNFATLEPYEFAGKGRQKFTYKGTEVLITVPQAESILPYHNVPLISKGQEYVDDRIWDSEIVTGHNKVDAKISINIDYEDMTSGQFYDYSNTYPPISVSRWRRGWRGFIGVVYYDSADRKSPVCIDPINSYTYIPSYSDEIFTGTTTHGLNPAFLRVSINHSPPEYAKKYSLVRTQDLSQQKYLLWVADEFDYVNDDDSQVSATPTPQTKYIRINVSNIAYYNDNSNKGAKIDFTFINGDRIRFIQSISGTFAPTNDYSIAKVDTVYIYIAYDRSFSPTSADGYLFEVYTPRLEAEDLLYYEFGEIMEVSSVVQNGISVKIHTGNIQNQSYAPSPLDENTPAIIESKDGDVWYRTRLAPYHSTGLVTFIQKYISSSTPSDYTDVSHDNNGRPNTTTIPGELKQDTGIVFSDQYISGTEVNGLGAVQPLNYRQFSTVYGPASKLLVVNNDILKIFFGNGYQLSIYVNQGVIRQSQGAGNIISVLDDVAANSHMIERSLGTVNPESVVLNDEGDVFGYDGTEGVCWLGAGNGLIDISNTGMSITWRQYGLQRLLLDYKKSKTPSVFDLSTDQYIITLNALDSIKERLPVATIKIPDITQDFLSQGGAQVDIYIQPNNQLIYSAFTPATSWWSIIQTAFSGWLIGLNNDGSIYITAPDVSNYKSSSIVITVMYNGSYTIPPTASIKTYRFDFTGGRDGSDAPPFQALTLAYSKTRKGWTNYFSFTPEMYGRLRNQIIGFVDGKLYLHSAGTTYNNFYGTQYDSRLRFVMNKDYPKVKVPLSVWYRGTGKWGTIITNVPTASYPYGQETEMTENHFLLEEDGYYSEVLKNRLDPRYPTTDQAWVNGEDIRGDAPEIEFYNKETTASRLDSTKTLYLYSENS